MRAHAHPGPTPGTGGSEPLPAVKLRDRRVQVSAITRARTSHGERVVRIVGISARTALLLSPELLGWSGQCVDLDVPIVGGHDLRVLAGIVRSERLRDGYVTTAEFIIVDTEVRRRLNQLLGLLLAHEPGDDLRQPSVVYDVAVAYGPLGQCRAHLQEVSLTGLAIRVEERMPHDLAVDVVLPSLHHGPSLALRGRVTGQRLSAEGGYLTTIDFEPLDGTRRRALGVLLADLMCR